MGFSNSIFIWEHHFIENEIDSIERYIGEQEGNFHNATEHHQQQYDKILNTLDENASKEEIDILNDFSYHQHFIPNLFINLRSFGCIAFLKIV